jgi:hypothetical protein
MAVGQIMIAVYVPLHPKLGFFLLLNYIAAHFIVLGDSLPPETFSTCTYEEHTPRESPKANAHAYEMLTGVLHIWRIHVQYHCLVTYIVGFKERCYFTHILDLDLRGGWRRLHNEKLHNL